MFYSLKEIVTHDLARCVFFILKCVRYQDIVGTFKKFKAWGSP